MPETACVHVSTQSKGRGRLTPIRKMDSKAKSEGTAAGTGTNFTSLQERSRSRYVAVAAGAFHTVLIRSDGSAVGSRGSLQIPRLPAGIRYIAVAANLEHTLFLRSDGHAVSCTNDSVECSLTSLTPSTSWHDVHIHCKRWTSCCVAAKRWSSDCIRTQWRWALQYPSVPFGNLVYSSGCRFSTFLAASKRWKSRCLWRKPITTWTQVIRRSL